MTLHCSRCSINKVLPGCHLYWEAASVCVVFLAIDLSYKQNCHRVNTSICFSPASQEWYRNFRLFEEPTPARSQFSRLSHLFRLFVLWPQRSKGCNLPPVKRVFHNTKYHLSQNMTTFWKRQHCTKHQNTLVRDVVFYNRYFVKCCCVCEDVFWPSAYFVQKCVRCQAWIIKRGFIPTRCCTQLSLTGPLRGHKHPTCGGFYRNTHEGRKVFLLSPLSPGKQQGVSPVNGADSWSTQSVSELHRSPMGCILTGGHLVFRYRPACLPDAQSALRPGKWLRWGWACSWTQLLPGGRSASPSTWTCRVLAGGRHGKRGRSSGPARQHWWEIITGENTGNTACIIIYAGRVCLKKNKKSRCENQAVLNSIDIDFNRFPIILDITKSSTQAYKQSVNVVGGSAGASWQNNILWGHQGSSVGLEMFISSVFDMNGAISELNINEINY